MGGKDCISMSWSCAETECMERADLTDLTDFVDRKAERREFARFRRSDDRESMCASVGGRGNIGVCSKVAG